MAENQEGLEQEVQWAAELGFESSLSMRSEAPNLWSACLKGRFGSRYSRVRRCSSKAVLRHRAAGFTALQSSCRRVATAAGREPKRWSKLGINSAMVSIFYVLAVTIVTGVSAGDMNQSQILDVFPKSVVQMPAAKRGKTVLSTTYKPSGSLWSEGLDENWVFNLEMKHEQGVDNSFALRVGKGGQIYSLRGPFGESLPPSWRGTAKMSPWNDEVWQFVAVCTKYNNADIGKNRKSPYNTSFFLHNSGTYIPASARIKNLYCPMLASEITPDRRCYRTVNWGLVPKVKTVHRSPLLYYCQTRDVGDGVIEMTWVVHNFSVRDDVVFDHLNAPWGGTRMTSLPFHYVSTPAGELKDRKDLVNDSNSVDVRKTGGWNLSCKSKAPDSPSLALVFGRDRHLEAELKKVKAGKPYCQFKNSLYRDWCAGEAMYKRRWKDWRTRPENSFRNYDVAVIIPKFRLAPGTSIWYRSFLVINRKDKAIEQAKSLVDKVDYGLATFDPTTTPTAPVTAGVSKFQLFPRPVKGTMPLFLIKNTKTGRYALTTDPYIFVSKEKVDLGLKKTDKRYDYYSKTFGYSMDTGASDWQRLLGYGYVKKPATGSWVKLSTVVDPKMFPKPDMYHLDLWVKKGK